MKPAASLHYPPATMAFEILQVVGPEAFLDGRKRPKAPKFPSFMDLPRGHERLLVRVLAPHSPYRVGDVLIFERPYPAKPVQEGLPA